jgi:hypothetical protein
MGVCVATMASPVNVAVKTRGKVGVGDWDMEGCIHKPGWVCVRSHNGIAGQRGSQNERLGLCPHPRSWRYTRIATTTSAADVRMMRSVFVAGMRKAASLRLDAWMRVATTALPVDVGVEWNERSG